MRAVAAQLALASLSCGRTTLPIEENEGPAISTCGSSGRWSSTPPQVLAPPTRPDSSSYFFDLAVAPERLAVVHDLFNSGRPRLAFRTIRDGAIESRMTLRGSRRTSSPTQLHFAPMRLSDLSIGDPIVVNAATSAFGTCLEAAKVVANGCGFVAVWREGCGANGPSRTLYYARIEPR